MAAPASIDAYLSTVPEPARSALESLRAIIRDAAPDATEGISYQIPTFRQGRSLVSFAAFRNHCSLFGMSAALFDALGDELAGYRTSKGTIQFTPDKPLPEELVRRIVKARLAENARLDARKRAKKA
jgi:uncharacterized protein YdhG (YjbR/CyaY superfamily)